MLLSQFHRSSSDKENLAEIRKSYITFSLLAAIFAVFMFTEYIAPELKMDLILAFGLDINLSIQPWSTITSAFLHDHWNHLLGNMFVLGIAGIIMERFITPAKFLAACFLALSSADLAEIFFIESNVITFGASGLSYGLLGLVVTNRMKIADWMLWFVLAFLAWDLIPDLFLVRDSTVAVLSHLGGFIGGCAAGLIYSEGRKIKHQHRVASKIDLSECGTYKVVLDKTYAKVNKISALIVMYLGVGVYATAIVISAARG